jgi:6-pyruvoyltetrahydropterin/6-carboxytetrahydropterin synthase
MKMRLGILEHFDAGHHLPGHPRCGTPHGHTYKVELTIEGENQGEMIIDFAVLKEQLRETLREFDHVDLNGILPYPTCENICEAIYLRLEKRLGFPFHLRVWEGEGKWAEI